jgi:hypothetical protein
MQAKSLDTQDKRTSEIAAAVQAGEHSETLGGG